jgi:hypothetical protein
MKAIYPMVGASAAACAQNLVSASFTGTFSSGWTFASTGVTPNGTSTFFNTDLPPSGNLAQNNAHASIYSRTNNLTGTQMDLGCGYTGNNTAFYLSAVYSTVRAVSNINGSGFSSAPSTNTTSLGFFIGQRASNTGMTIHQNNNLVRTFNAASTTPAIQTINLGRNFTSEYSLRELAFASFGESFNSTELANLNTDVQAFQTTLSRNV